MAAQIVPSFVLETRRAERRKAAALDEIAALQSDMMLISGFLTAAQDRLIQVSFELDQAAARLHYAQLFSERCQEIMATDDLNAMISMRASLLLSPLADEVLSGPARRHQLMLIEATAH